VIRRASDRRGHALPLIELQSRQRHFAATNSQRSPQMLAYSIFADDLTICVQLAQLGRTFVSLTISVKPDDKQNGCLCGYLLTTI
jgi:hypothetical protein